MEWGYRERGSRRVGGCRIVCSMGSRTLVCGADGRMERLIIRS